MISKNEVIIANCLNKYKKSISYSYENKLKLEIVNKTIKPDFTIENLNTGENFLLGAFRNDDKIRLPRQVAEEIERLLN